MESFRKQAGLAPYFETAYGFAVFDTIAKAGVGIGGAGGHGDVYVNKPQCKKVGESNMVQLSFGFQFGGQVYSEIIFFETEKDFSNFCNGNFEFGADANVVALTASARTSATTMGNQGPKAGLSSGQVNVAEGLTQVEYTKGMKVFTLTKGGLMYQATVSGQKFTYHSV